MLEKRRFTQLNPTEILQPLPKSYNKLLEWLPVDVKTTDERNQIAHQMLMYTPRFLFDFFDDQKLYINIESDFEFKGFIWYINDNGITGTDTRIDAEEAAFKEAFKLLEELL
jgi:hypothetical protein